MFGNSRFFACKKPTKITYCTLSRLSKTYEFLTVSKNPKNDQSRPVLGIQNIWFSQTSGWAAFLRVTGQRPFKFFYRKTFLENAPSHWRRKKVWKQRKFACKLTCPLSSRYEDVRFCLIRIVTPFSCEKIGQSCFARNYFYLTSQLFRKIER